MPKHEIRGKVVALTGGARGIGLETVKALLQRGAKVGVGDLDLELLAQELAALGGETAAFQLDVTERDSFEAFVDGVEHELGPIDVLINNAGLMSLSNFFDEEDHVVDRMIDVNFRGPILGMKIVMPRMIKRGDGHVINIVSASGRLGVPGAATYSATKFAAYGLSDAVARELSAAPVAVTAVMPTVVNTELTMGVTGSTLGVPTIEPQDVAAVVLEAIEKRPFEIFAPKSLKAKFAVGTLLPRSVRDFLSRITHADDVLVDIDRDGRDAYQQRAFGAKTPTLDER
ncbi:MAG: SDR family oxidoreductase [Thermoleophilaceae bacterium]|nr:SDR family oxidoreductase [Thermoleophilaceae bacterium]